MGLKGLFWKGDGEETPEPDEADVPRGQNTSVSSRPVQRVPAVMAGVPLGPSASIFQRTTGVISSIGSASQPTVDKEFDAVISNALDQESKEPGLKEFMAQFNALSGVITDRVQCTRAALAAVSASNPRLNAQQIAKSVGERMRLLSTFEASYMDEARKRESEETRDKSATISDLENRTKEVDADMARLVAERTQLQSQVAQLQVELSTVTAKYDGPRSRFSATVSARTEEYKRLLSFVSSKEQ